MALAALMFAAPARAEGPVSLGVSVEGAIPGFAGAEAAEYLAAQMNSVGAAGWSFHPGIGSVPDRVEWRVTPQALASGGMRQFFPMPAVQRLFGNRHQISVEMRLYIGGQYQTLTYGQTVIQGGPQDEDLAAFVARMTRDLLGEHGAYRAIDIAPGGGH